MEVLPVLIGAVLLWPVGLMIGRFINRVLTCDHVEAPSGIQADDWRAAVQGPGPGAAYIGRLESLLVYLAVLFARGDAALVVAGWFAFKVASKWELWSNVVKMPDSFDGATQLDSLRARRKLGYVMYDRFLVGTLLNILAGAIVAGFVLRYTHAG